MLIRLYSVASAIDSGTMDVYAMYQDGRYDEDSKKPLQEMPKSWLDALDKYDRQLILRFLKIKL
jgi:hypothetical protein